MNDFLNRQSNSDTSTDVFLPGQFGGTGKQSIDGSDIPSRAYSSDWFRIFSLPRPMICLLDLCSGILTGSIIGAITLTVSGLFGTYVGAAICGGILSLLSLVGLWVLRTGSDWERAGVVYRTICIIAGLVLFL